MRAGGETTARAILSFFTMKSRTASPDDKSLLPAFSSSTDEDVSFDGEAVEYHEQSFTRYLGFVVLSGVVSSFQFGYNLGGTTPLLHARD